MALDPGEFDRSTGGLRDAQPRFAPGGGDKPAGGRKWMSYLWIPMAVVALVLASVNTSLRSELEQAHSQINGLRQQVSGLENENQQLKDQAKAHAQRATRSLEFGQVLVGKSTDTLADTAGDVHLAQAGLETIQFVATGPSALSDATAYGNLSIEFVEPDGDSLCAGELPIENGESNEWAVSGKCSGEGEFAAGEWQIRFSYRGRAYSRTFTVDAP
jgi:outer membrane murein-binding lipoprotein Lpp